MPIEVKNLSFAYADRTVLRDISFSVERGEFLSVLGPNGVGKSTLFRCMLGLLSGYTGQVLVDGVDARSFFVWDAAKHIAYIPQSSRPIFNYSVFDIVLMGRTAELSVFRSPGRADREVCERALEKVGIAELRDRCYHRLSGGEQQLVLIARALVQQAPNLMLDEPTANLDLGNQLLVLEQARSLARKTILYCLGDKGTQVIARGSFHAETMNMLAENAAVLEDVVAKGTGNEVDMEQLLLWDPEYIIFAPDSCFHEIAGDEQWQQLSAVAAGRVYLTPESPYGWLSSPPAVQRCLGMLWLGELLYPEYTDYDLREEITEYYRLFYGCDLTRELYSELTENALPN